MDDDTKRCPTCMAPVGEDGRWYPGEEMACGYDAGRAEEQAEVVRLRTEVGRLRAVAVAAEMRVENPWPLCVCHHPKSSHGPVYEHAGCLHQGLNGNFCDCDMYNALAGEE